MIRHPSLRKFGPRAFAGLLFLLAFVALGNLYFGPQQINQGLYDASVVIVMLAVPPATLFPILYAKWFPWWKSTLGRALFVKATGMALLIDVAVLYSIFGDDYFLREYVRILVYSLIVGGQWWQLIAIIKIRREEEQEKARLLISEEETRL